MAANWSERTLFRHRIPERDRISVAESPTCEYYLIKNAIHHRGLHNLHRGTAQSLLAQWCWSSSGKVANGNSPERRPLAADWRTCTHRDNEEMR